MEFPLTSLPNEVLITIFSHLTVKDRLRASLVCKNWLELINCKSLLKDINVHISHNDGILDFLHMTRNFLQFTFYDIGVNKYFMQLFKLISPHAKVICFENCYMERTEPVSIEDVPPFNCLTHLMVIDCDLWCLFPALPNLKEFHLSGKSTITDDGIAILQKTMKQLKVFRISCDIAFDHKAYKRFYPEGLTYERNPSSLILSFLAIKSFITERARTLTELNFYYNQLTPSALEQLSQIKDLKLTKMSFHFFRYQKSLNIFFKFQTNLSSLNIDNINLCDDIVIDTLYTHLPNIKELRIQNSVTTDHTLKQIFKLKLLEELKFCHNVGSTSTGFHEAISCSEVIQLNKISLSSIEILPISAPYIKQWENVVYLSLVCCHLLDVHVHTISTFLVSLKYLNLSLNPFTNYGLIGVSASSDNQELASSDNKVIYVPPLYNLKLLAELVLDSCPNLTEEGLIEAIIFPNLKTLSIKGKAISRNTLSILNTNNPNLNMNENIYLSQKETESGQILEQHFYY